LAGVPPAQTERDAVYDADPEAQFFLSWSWLAKWLATLARPWFILAARPDAGSDYVAFLPLRLRTTERRSDGIHTELNIAGNYGSDYTGFICAPEFQQYAIPALAKHFGQLNWTAPSPGVFPRVRGAQPAFLRQVLTQVVRHEAKRSLQCRQG
jgi:hypothetical protein